jgi:hypothetical protein
MPKLIRVIGKKNKKKSKKILLKIMIGKQAHEALTPIHSYTIYIVNLLTVCILCERQRTLAAFIALTRSFHYY